MAQGGDGGIVVFDLVDLCFFSRFCSVLLYYSTEGSVTILLPVVKEVIEMKNTKVHAYKT